MTIYELCIKHGDWFCRVPPVPHGGWNTGHWAGWVYHEGRFVDLPYWRRVLNQRVINSMN